MIPALSSAPPRFETTQATAPTATGMASATSGAGSLSAQADFSSVLAEVAGDAMTTLKSAETTSIKGINGQATTQQVVESVMAAERTLQTAVSLRDKAVSAYMELTRMGM